MRSIYINGRFLGQNRTGVQRYSRQVVAAMDRLLDHDQCPPLLRDAEWKLLAPPGTECDLNLRRIQFCEIGSGSGHLWEQIYLARHARSGRLLSPAGSGPLGHRRHVVVIHDAAIYNAPAGYARSYRICHKIIDQVLVRTAKIATVSRFSRSELASCLHIQEEKILLAPNGTDHFQAVFADAAIVERLKLTPGKYFLTLGLSTANKNISLAIEAHARLNRPDIKLVVVGKGSERVRKTPNFQANPRVVFTGRLTDEEVTGLLRSAAALVFPSRYEGFGIPLLEAMAQGCPVIASTAGAVLEVCGDAALHFDPDNVYGLTDLMSRLIADKDIAATLRKRGLARPQKYQWRTAAAALMRGLQDVESDVEPEEAMAVSRDYENVFPLR